MTQDIMSARRGCEVELRCVKKSFGDAEVLRGVSLTIKEGEFIAVVGRSGSGKSTLLRLISGLDTPSDGEVLVDGRPVTGVDSTVRYLFQEPRLLPWKRVIENVELGRGGGTVKTSLEMLSKVGLTIKADQWPERLSGGQKQRVALARALLGVPKVLLFDEPLGALDALTRLEMQALIESLYLAERWSAVLVTHDVDEAVTLADRVLVIDEGVIKADLRISLARPRRDNGDKTHFAKQILAAIFAQDGQSSPLRAGDGAFMI